MYKVQVLLSTYNGEKYIKEQIDSILNQERVQVSLLIRDDGSTDSTIEILKEYCIKYKNIQIIEAHNIGVAGSFFELFKKADTLYEFFALSDQDDVWNKDKLFAACQGLEQVIASNKSSKPVLYCCEADITDESLQSTTKSISTLATDTKKPGFGNALIENIARGGSIVFNKALLNMVRIDCPEGCYMHDWWLYLTASCFGKVIYDNTPHYKYRQHPKNVLGASTSKLAVLKRRLKQSQSNRGHVSIQATAFAKAYDIPHKKQPQLDVITKYRHSFRQRIRGLSGKYLYRQSKSDNLVFKLLFLTNHL